MAWQDNLLPASFRGVPFFYADTEDEGGRRTVEHEFPLRDAAYVEDLGLKNRRYKIQAYVLGDNYMAQRDALIAALSAFGPGTLVHPYRGLLTVQVDKFRCRETLADGREASFELEFLDAGSIPSPTSVVDTSGAALAAGGGAFAQLSASFLLAWALSTGAGTAAAAALLLASAGGALAALLSLAGVTPALSAPFLVGFAGLSGAAAIAEAVTGFGAAYPGDVVASQPVFDDTQSSRGPLTVPDPAFGLATLAEWGDDLAAIAPTTPALAQQAQNQAALIALVQGTAAAALAALYAQTDFASEDDAETARDTITGLIDGLRLTASAAGDDDAVAAWDALYLAIAADLTTRGKQLPGVETLTFAAALPALFLAELIYQDASEAGALVARNQAPHPLFLPLAIEALSPA